MGWSDWPTWLKGGVIALILWVIVFTIALIFCLSITCKSESCLFCAYFTSMLNPLNFLLWGGLQALVMYFLIGAIIGWIIGMVKKK